MKITRNFAFALAAALAAAPLAHAGTFGGEVTVSNTSVSAQFPEIAYSSGIAHVVWVGYDVGGSDIFYRRSTTATGNFNSQPIVNLSNSPGNDRPQVAANGSHVIAGWNSNNDTGAIYTRRSLDGGVSWQPAVLSAGVEGGQYSRISDLLIDSAGRVHVAYYTDQDPPNVGLVGMIHHRMSCDGGATWGTDTAVTATAIDSDVDNEQPRLSELGGRIYIAFRSTRRGNPQGGWPPYSIVMQSGTVSGCAVTNWSYPARHVAGGVPLTQSTTYRPDIYSDGSKMHVAWWDNTAGAQVFYRYGNPGAGTLSARAQLSSFGVQHVEPGGIASTPSVAAGGFESPPSIVSNGATAFVAYASQTGQVSGLEYGLVRMRESSDNGGVWGAEQNIAGSNQGATPHMAIDTANTQNVGIVWTDLSTQPLRVKYRLYTLGALGGGPALSFSADPVAFGNRPVGTSATLNVNIVNAGTVATFSSLNIVNTSGLAASDYAITGNTCAATLGAGASCTLTVQFTAKALGARNAAISVGSNDPGSPTITALSGTGTNGGVFNNNVSAVVTGYYETILGRSPDAGGLNFWVGEANRMVALGANSPSVSEVFFAMSIQFFNSAEYLAKNTSDSQYITDLYRTFFLRDPDGPGQSFWQSELNAGLDRGALLTNFLFSTEFSNFMTGLFGNPPVRPEINMTIDLYRGILGVLPDSGGFNFWLSQIRAAQCQGSTQVKAKVAELASAFANSPEYANREAARPAPLRTKMHVGDLYNAFLRRGAESGGYNFWVNTLQGGFQTRDEVRTAFVQSPEFDARVTQVINTTCMP